MSGGVALGLVMGGALLLAIECNRPGRVIPGAVGLLVLLLGVNRLRMVAGAGSESLWLASFGLALIAVVRWRPLRGVPGFLGTGLLAGALVHLARRSGGELNATQAGCCGVLLGGVCTWLMMIAAQAWRAKSGHRGASAGSFASGVRERWGVD